jgi:hypothetical protein
MSHNATRRLKSIFAKRQSRILREAGLSHGCALEIPIRLVAVRTFSYSERRHVHCQHWGKPLESQLENGTALFVST